jgi:nucleobase:cation symporter-1, NCS1 family
MAALFPKYVTIRRGFFICAVVSIAINPWYLLGSASVFVSFLASYQIFLSAITGVLLANYYLVCRGHIDIPDCFTSSKSGVYHYWHGWNLRAYAAYGESRHPFFSLDSLITRHRSPGSGAQFLRIP